MWALLSTRLRTWLLFAVAVPLLRVGVHRAARHLQASRPDGRATKALSASDRALTRVSRRRR